jgi:hypothetical protein
MVKLVNPPMNMDNYDTPPNSLKDLEANLKVKTSKEEKVGVCS